MTFIFSFVNSFVLLLVVEVKLGGIPKLSGLLPKIKNEQMHTYVHEKNIRNVQPSSPLI